MDIQKLEELLKQPEGAKLDYKEILHLQTESDKKEFVKDICAIANSKGGRGYIIFGVKDKNKEIVGVSLEPFDEERMQQIICNRCSPPVPVRVDILAYKQKDIAVVTIFKSDQRPHQIRQTGTFYLRRGSTTDIAHRHEIANMLQESGLVTYETVLLRKASMEDLDPHLIKNQLLSALSGESASAELILESFGFIGKDSERDIYHPTLGGMLLLGKCPQKYLFHTSIRIEYYGKVQYIQGNIPTMLDLAEESIGQIFSQTHYPVEAIYEALANAVVHRDYWDTTREITISIERNQVEITNPGALWTTGGIYRIVKDQNPPRRNPWLYQRLLLLDKKSRFLKYGLGIRRMEKAFVGIEKVKVINIASKNLFKVVLPGEAYF